VCCARMLYYQTFVHELAFRIFFAV